MEKLKISKVYVFGVLFILHLVLNALEILGVGGRYKKKWN